jgi:hypothetical protein
MTIDDSEAFADRVQCARVWLQGFVVESQGFYQSKRLEEDTAQEKEGRRAIAQLLVDGNAPGEILDLLATLLAPDVSARLKVGEQLFRSGDPQIILSLSGSDHVLRLRRRDRVRYSDGHLIGCIISLVQEKIDAGASLERAFFEASERAEAAGIERMSPSNVRKIWNKSKSLREQIFDPPS